MLSRRQNLKLKYEYIGEIKIIFKHSLACQSGTKGRYCRLVHLKKYIPSIQVFIPIIQIEVNIS